jgi:flagellar basal body rod protein FlgG
MLTRDGNFRRDSQGQLVTSDGHALMGESGPIQLPEGETFEVAGDGRVMGSVSGEIDRLKLVDAPNATQRGASLWDPGDVTRAATPEVIQGALEGSNVDPVGLMVELVEAHRHFEAQQRVMQASDEMDARLNRSGGQ